MPKLPDFSYRSDPRVPAFDHRFRIALMAAKCAPGNPIDAGFARNRYSGFGRGDLCAWPSPTLGRHLRRDPP